MPTGLRTPVYEVCVLVHRPDVYILHVLSAAGLTDLLTLYFSHPAVEGVLLWGFWDGLIWLDESKLAEGPNVTVVVTYLF